MKGLPAIAAIVAITCSAITPCWSTPKRVDHIPNGNVFSCANCHIDPAGGGQRNAFGQHVEFYFLDEEGDVVWNGDLSLMDSDSDGISNGSELQDPSGTWTIGKPDPGDPDHVLNPGQSNNLLRPVSPARIHHSHNTSFQIRRLINLPTTNALRRGEILFRISHRYDLAVREGSEYLYGLDGPAKIYLSLGYGIRDNVNVTLGRTNLNDIVELSFSWRMIQQGRRFTMPFSAALNIGGSLVTDPRPCHGVFEAENMKLNVQLSVSHQVNRHMSLLLVPSFSSNTNHWASDSEGTFTLGTGGRYTFLKNLSVLGEWLPVLSGYEADARGWGFGLEYRMGGHVFQVFLTNSRGLTSDQFIPGGDLDLEESDYRLGFNIFRSFQF